MDAHSKNSPDAHEIATLKHADRWRQVGVGNASVYIPWNAPVEVSKTASWMIVFRRVENVCEAIKRSVEGEGAGNGNQNWEWQWQHNYWNQIIVNQPVQYLSTATCTPLQ